MEDFLKTFIEEEIDKKTYAELFAFIKSDGIVRGTYECQRYVVMKISERQLIVYRICVGAENVAVQEACVVAKEYLLKKINSRAYALGFEDIKNIKD